MKQLETQCLSMDAVQVLEQSRAEIESLCRRYGVRRLSLFGSATTNAWDPATSDFDFLVEYGPESDVLEPLDRLVGLQLDLERLLGRRVDAVDWGATKNPHFRALAKEQAREFYAA